MAKNQLAKVLAESKRQIKEAYEAGHQHGYEDGIDATHTFWVHVVQRTKGIGPKTAEVLQKEATAYAEEQRRKMFPAAPEAQDLAQMVREELNKPGSMQRGPIGD